MAIISKLLGITVGDRTWIAASRLLTQDSMLRECFVYGCVAPAVCLAWLEAEIGLAKEMSSALGLGVNLDIPRVTSPDSPPNSPPRGFQVEDDVDIEEVWHHHIIQLAAGSPIIQVIKIWSLDPNIRSPFFTGTQYFFHLDQNESKFYERFHMSKRCGFTVIWLITTIYGAPI